MARSLNRVQLIGNLTRDPELRYTPQGTAVCTFGLATNRNWVTDSGEKKEEAEFHRIVAWNKLGELCSQLLTKGRKVYVEGRLSTRSWTAQDGAQKSLTEIVIDDMIILDSRKEGFREDVPADEDIVAEKPARSTKKEEKEEVVSEPVAESASSDDAKAASSDDAKAASSDDVNPDDIPF